MRNSNKKIAKRCSSLTELLIKMGYQEERLENARNIVTNVNNTIARKICK